MDDKTQQALAGLIGGVAAGAVGGEGEIARGQTIAQSATEFNRQLHADEIDLQKTKDAQMLKQAIADYFPNVDERTVEAIFALTQSGMVNFFDAYRLEMIINSQSNAQNKEDLRFIVNEAKAYFTEASKGKVYVDRNTLALVPMMDTNNYRDSTYNPQSNANIIKESLVSTGLALAGLVPNPAIAIPAWIVDTGRSALTNDYSDFYGSLQNLSPNYIGNPWTPIGIQKAGAAGSFFNTIQSIDTYENKLKQLEIEKERINNAHK